MSIYFHQLVTNGAHLWPNNPAISHQNKQLSYSELEQQINKFSHALAQLSTQQQARIGVFLPKCFESVISLFGASAASKVFVPINPVLKPLQVNHILRDCGVEILVTSSARLQQLQSICNDLKCLKQIIVIDKLIDIQLNAQLHLWSSLLTASPATHQSNAQVSSDMAAILYTSGSTGAAKGVVLSHQNLVYGAKSVAQYLENNEKDNILALLPLSFDYGLSQITTAFVVGAHCILMDYLLPNDVVKAVKRHQITGIAGVPPLWSALMKCDWSTADLTNLRYFTNSGGAMPKALLASLRAAFPNASPYLMYGLTEAFRSTYLSPQFIDSHAGSIGKAIPNAQISVITQAGNLAKDGEVGELVHSGPLVSLGYWNAPEKTAQRFKPLPQTDSALCLTQYAVFSGDWVTRDQDGFLYFVGRKDDMIKSSGYRISPSEIEEAIYQQPQIIEAAALGLPHDELGHGILIIYQSEQNQDLEKILINACRSNLANFMQPHRYLRLDNMPHNANGKIDRSSLASHYKNTFITDQL